jgi:hypothetical protein
MTVESLACPNCGAALPAGSTGTLTCRFCNSTVTLRTDPPALPARDSDVLVRNLIEQKKTIDAIRMYRETRACTLKEARDGVAAMAGEMGMNLGSGRESKLTCPFLAFAGLAWAPLIVLIPILVRRAMEAGKPFSTGKAALVQAVATAILLGLTIWVVVILSRRSTRLRGPGENGREGGAS